MSNIQQNHSSREMHSAQKVVLIVEDDLAIAEMLIQTIDEETGHSVLHTTDTVDALNILRNMQPDMLILNYHLPHMTGIELHDKAISMWGNIPTLMLSANLPRNELAKRGIIGIDKPFELDELLNTIEQLLLSKSA